MDAPCKRGPKDTAGGKGTLEAEPHNWDQLHKNGSILISREEQGMVSSNLVITSGWRTPSFPMLWPRAKISAHRPGKNAEPETEGEKNQCFFWGGKVNSHLTLKAYRSPLKITILLEATGYENVSSHFLVVRSTYCVTPRNSYRKKTNQEQIWKWEPTLLIMGAELGGCRSITRVLGELSPRKDTGESNMSLHGWNTLRSRLFHTSTHVPHPLLMSHFTLLHKKPTMKHHRQRRAHVITGLNRAPSACQEYRL